MYIWPLCANVYRISKYLTVGRTCWTVGKAVLILLLLRGSRRFDFLARSRDC